MSSPWNKNITLESEPVNLQDVMLEELSKNAKEKENRKYNVFAFSTDEEIEIPKEVSSQQNQQLKSDEELAKMLQHQYNEERGNTLDSKIFASELRVSLTSLDEEASMNIALDSDDEELEDTRDKNEWDKLGMALKEFDPIPAYNNNGSPTTKNYVQLSNSTICKLISFPWNYVPGASIEKKKTPKRRRYYWYHEEPKIEEPILYGIDDGTKMLLYKMFKIQLLQQIHGLISVGDEALILHAKTNPEYQKSLLATDCAIKIFKTTLSESKQKDKFITEDYRFKGMWKRSGELDMLKTACYWAQQEVHILQRLKKAGIACPDVISLKRNILVMSYLNSESSTEPAPKLRDAFLDMRELTNAYEQVVHYMKVMFNECNLIHGDLSAKNILWSENICYVIDVSQFVRRTHDKALLLLYKDCESISSFFMQKGLPNVATSEDLFTDITGYDPKNRFVWAEYQKTLKIKSQMDVTSDVTSD